MTDIIRLRGNAPPLIWPAAELAPILTELAVERGQWSGLLRHINQKTSHNRSLECGSPPNPYAVRAVGPAEARCAALASRAIDAFAHANDMKLRRAAAWPARVLGRPAAFCWAHERILDHPQILTGLHGGRVRCMVVHNYGPLPVDRIPETWVVDQLPNSWYFRGDTTAYAIREAST